MRFRRLPVPCSRALPVRNSELRCNPCRILLMTARLHAVAALALAASSLPVNFAHAQGTLRPLVLSGYNQDVIAEGTYSGPDSVAQSTSATIDTTFDYYARGFDGDFPNAGLPAGNTFVSAANPAAAFLLQPAGNNNVLLLTDQTAGASTVSLTLVYPGRFTTLALLVTGLESSNPVGYTLRFADGGSTQGSFVAADNFVGAAPIAIAGFGRVHRTQPASRTATPAARASMRSTSRFRARTPCARSPPSPSATSAPGCPAASSVGSRSSASAGSAARKPCSIPSRSAGSTRTYRRRPLFRRSQRAAIDERHARFHLRLLHGGV